MDENKTFFIPDKYTADGENYRSALANWFIDCVETYIDTISNVIGKSGIISAYNYASCQTDGDDDYFPHFVAENTTDGINNLFDGCKSSYVAERFINALECSDERKSFSSNDEYIWLSYDHLFSGNYSDFLFVLEGKLENGAFRKAFIEETKDCLFDICINSDDEEMISALANMDWHELSEP